MGVNLRSAAVIAASVGVVAVLTPAAAEAKTSRELNVCWTGRGTTQAVALRVIVDGGHQIKVKDKLLSGKCQTWSLPTGTYGVYVENGDQFYDYNDAEKVGVCGVLPPGANYWSVRPTTEVRRSGVSYRTNGLGAGVAIKKDRRTSVSMSITCKAFTF